MTRFGQLPALAASKKLDKFLKLVEPPWQPCWCRTPPASEADTEFFGDKMSLLFNTKEFVKKILPVPMYGKVRHTANNLILYSSGVAKLPISSYLKIANGFRFVNNNVDCAHTSLEILEVAEYILSLPKDAPSVFVEAGCWKGGSTAKLSLACKLGNKKLSVFDSFEGIPENIEQHGKNIWGKTTVFPKGSYADSLDNVKDVITKYGDISVCTFHKGWFKDTMPHIDAPICGAFIDVDLESSTKDCIINLYKHLHTGGVLFSQDGHLPLIIKLLGDRKFWTEEAGAKTPPRITGLGQKKLVRIQKMEA